MLGSFLISWVGFEWLFGLGFVFAVVLVISGFVIQTQYHAPYQTRNLAQTWLPHPHPSPLTPHPCRAGLDANRFSPSLSERKEAVSCPRTLLPVPSSGGE